MNAATASCVNRVFSHYLLGVGGVGTAILIEFTTLLLREKERKKKKTVLDPIYSRYYIIYYRVSLTPKCVLPS